MNRFIVKKNMSVKGIISLHENRPPCMYKVICEKHYYIEVISDCGLMVFGKGGAFGDIEEKNCHLCGCELSRMA